MKTERNSTAQAPRQQKERQPKGIAKEKPVRQEQADKFSDLSGH